MARIEVEGQPGRLDVVLASLTGIPRADVQRAITDGRVLVDGEMKPKSFRLSGGERIEADVRGQSELAPEGGGVPVRYEDAHLLVVAKPAGMVTHPTPSRRTGTLVNRLLGMGIPLSEGGDRPGIVHLLDDRKVRREYLALVRGSVQHDAFAVEAPLGRRGARVTVQRGTGVEASTDFTVRERLPGATLLVARPRTGRTHQIRVHLSALGHPILGDRTYRGGGDDAARLGLIRPFLHAWRLAFDHPVTGKRIEVEEPLPDDLAAALEKARA